MTENIKNPEPGEESVQEEGAGQPDDRFLMGRLLSNGHLCIFLGAFFFGFMSVQVKMIGDEVPTGVILFCRFVLGIFVTLAITRVAGYRVVFYDKRYMISRSVFGLVAIYLLYASIRLIPVGNAVTFNNTFPVWIAIITLVAAGVAPSLRVILTLAISFLGVYLVANPRIDGFGAGDAMGLVSGLAAAFAVLSVKASRRRNPAFIVLLFFCLVGALATSPFLLTAPAPSGRAALLLIGVGAAGTAGQLLMNQGMKYAPATEGAIVNTLTVVVSASLGALLFGDNYGLRFFAGVACLFGSAGYLTLRTSIEKRRALEDAKKDREIAVGGSFE